MSRTHTLTDEIETPSSAAIRRRDQSLLRSIAASRRSAILARTNVCSRACRTESLEPSVDVATICAGKEMATSRSDKTQVDACEEVARGLSPEKRAAWVGFMKSHAALTKALDADLIANVGIPLSAFEVLFSIAYSAEGYLRMSDVAEQARLSPSRVSRLVTELERRGYLERRTCESDSRVVYAAITDEGREVLAKVEELHFEG